ncbi:MAG TPA: PQQ-binding-like beta-propeller repeat protein [Pirellulaceae bacterium]|nr:PQQ-binding-like beta-propeller repeat protein [Pirellulaceae bacterium]
MLSLVVMTSTVQAENWPQWRGVHNDGVSAEKNLPTKWSKTEGVLWRTPLPGPAGATPVVFGERVFLTSVDKANGDLLLLCLGIDGQEQWRRKVSSGNKDVRGDEGNSASPSPVTDGEHVWTFMANGKLACYTVTGDEVWQLDVQDRYGKLSIAFGMTSTPVLDGDVLYLQLIHGEGKAATREAKVVALDKKTGHERWAVARPSDATDECEHSYASPILYRDDQRAYLLSHGADYIVAHDLKDGHELWRCGDLNPKGKYERTLRFVASPVAVPGLIIVPSAKNYPVLALKPNGQGDLTEQPAAFAWRLESGTPDVPSPLIVGDYVYLCRENGNLVCLERATGKKLYEKTTTRDRHRASPVYADGHIYTAARNGMMSVTKVGPEFEIVSQNNMEESISSSPVIANGRLYIRTFDALYCIGK